MTVVQEHFLVKKQVPRVHHRLVVQEIGLPLTAFNDFGELSTVLAHALIGMNLILSVWCLCSYLVYVAHMQAWENAGVLHRDISVGNILIDPSTRCGLLIDWDLSRLASELERDPVEPDRTARISITVLDQSD